MIVQLDRIVFDHTPGAAANDALSIRIDRANTAPDWIRGATDTSYAAYALVPALDQQLTIHADFSFPDPLLASATRDLDAAVAGLAPGGSGTTASADAAIKAARRVERVYRAAMGQLLAVDDLREVMARRELYRRGARIADAVVDVAERILYAVVKEA